MITNDTCNDGIVMIMIKKKTKWRLMMITNNPIKQAIQKTFHNLLLLLSIFDLVGTISNRPGVAGAALQTGLSLID